MDASTADASGWDAGRSGPAAALRRVEWVRIQLPLVQPFRTSAGASAMREIGLLRVETDLGVGWGECSAELSPLYLSEFLDAAEIVLRDHLVPRIVAAGALVAASVGPRLAPVRGHQMAKSALEMAMLDAELRASGESFGSRLGITRSSVPVGVAVGIMPTVDDLLGAVETYVASGYRRVKLKIGPGADIEPVRAVRAAHPDLMLQVDANSAYTIGDIDHLSRLDEFGLLFIEQPFAERDFVGHAALGARIATPVCLDESIGGLDDVSTALALGSAAVINIKPSRVGGYLTALAIHDRCAAEGVPVWCGGMFETGLGRAANLALAALDGFSLPGDISATDRYWARDITRPFVLDDGEIAVPTGPGFGVEVDDDALDAVTVSRQDWTAAR